MEEPERNIFGNYKWRSIELLEWRTYHIILGPRSYVQIECRDPKNPTVLLPVAVHQSEAVSSADY